MPKQKAEFERVYARMWNASNILGYLVSFKSKTMHHANAYFPSLSNMDSISEFTLMCPVLALNDIVRRGLLKNGFLKGLNKKKRLTKYLQLISGLEHYIAPYTLYESVGAHGCYQKAWIASLLTSLERGNHQKHQPGTIEQHHGLF